MKRVALVLIILLSVAVFSGCDVVNSLLRMAVGDSSLFGQPAASATSAPLSVDTELSNMYTSGTLGLSFTVPDRWIGKFRVVEGENFLTVYFNPAEPVDETMGEGEFFCIVRKTPDIDESCYDNAREIDVGGVTYIWGKPTDVQYQQGEPEYDTYLAMQQDLPAICDSVKAADCN